MSEPETYTLAALEDMAHDRKPPRARVINIPATGSGAAFDLGPDDALKHMKVATEAVSTHITRRSL